MAESRRVNRVGFGLPETGNERMGTVSTHEAGDAHYGNPVVIRLADVASHALPALSKP
jgi:hypothetical protein